jgi:hypothetical protein
MSYRQEFKLFSPVSQQAGAVMEVTRTRRTNLRFHHTRYQNSKAPESPKQTEGATSLFQALARFVSK